MTPSELQPMSSSIAAPVGPFALRICAGCGQQINDGHHAHGGRLSPVYDVEAAPVAPTSPPAMALRPDHEHTDEMDDIVVKDVEMFRAEAMSDDVWWMACYFANGEQVTFHVSTEGPANRKQRLSVSVTDEPPEWLDIDKDEAQL